MAPLHRAVALSERDHVPVCVGEQLHLDVARPLEVALAVERAVPEGSRSLALCGRERILQLAGRPDDAHPSAAAAGRGLHEQREADLVRAPVREHGNAGLASDPLRLELVAAEPQRFRRRADPGQPGCFDGLREVPVLREEAVSRMDRVRPVATRAARMCSSEWR